MKRRLAGVVGTGVPRGFLAGGAVVGVAAVVALLIAGPPTNPPVIPHSVAVPLLSTTVSTALLVVAVVAVLAVTAAVVLVGTDGSALSEWWRGRSLWVRAAALGFVVTVIAALGVVVVYSPFPVVLGPAGLLATWLLSTAGIALRARWSSSESRLRIALRESGYAHHRGPDRRALAVFVGGAAAVCGAVVTAVLSGWYTESVNSLAVLTTGGMLWLVGTVLSYRRSVRATGATDLPVLDVRRTASGMEMTIRNDGDRVLDLAGGTLRDTAHDRYRIERSRSLAPGETCTLRLPDSVSIAPDDATLALPFGYTLATGSDFPVVFGRRGDRYRLRPDSERSALGSRESDSGV